MRKKGLLKEKGFEGSSERTDRQRQHGGQKQAVGSRQCGAWSEREICASDHRTQCGKLA